MKVGVYHGSAGPEHGGIHTFVATLREALLDLAPESRHSFVMLAGGAMPGHEPWPDNVDVMRLDEQGPLEEPARGGLFKKGPKPKPPSLDEMVAASGAECVWSLEAWHPPFEVPYITPVWDIQHRLQPWFPEVSAGGEWSRREQHYAALLQRASYVITGTERGKQEVAGFYGVPEPRVRVLPQPTPRFAAEAAAKEPAALPGDMDLPPGYLLYPAQFWAHKNHVGLLRALRVLKDEHALTPALALTGADHGNIDKVRRAARDLGVEDQVRFLGLVSADALVALYQNALALTFASLFGPDNLPPLEAFVLGCPVIATDVPGSEEQLGDAALRVDTLDPAAFAAAIHRLHEDASLRDTLIARGCERAPWTSEDFVRGVLGMLDELAPYVATWQGPGSA